MHPYFREMVWGGRRLQEVYDKPLPAGRPIGESFELSAYPGRESVVAAGPLAGWNLSSLVRQYGEQLLGRQMWQRCGDRFPLLIKLLDAQQDLSIQVHPDDAYALGEGLEDRGKMEAWFVLDSAGGRVAHGLRPGVGREAFAEAIRAGRVEETVRFHPVKPGDVLFMPPGTVHALCSGVMIYEVQQSSDLTFRISDYGRLGLDGKPRKLHLREALAVIDFGAQSPGPVFWRDLPAAREDSASLVECEHFRLHLYRPGKNRLEHEAGDYFRALTLVEGAATVSGGAPDSFTLRSGETALIPALREFCVEPESGADCTYLIAAPAL